MFIYFVSLLASYCLYIIGMGILSLVINTMKKSDNEQALGERWYTFIFIIYAGIVSILIILKLTIVHMLCGSSLSLSLPNHRS